MVVCFSCSPDVFPTKNPFSTPKFRSQDAFLLLEKCTNFTHLKQIHGKIIRHELSNDQLLLRQMIQLCSSYGKIDYAALVFNQIKSLETFSWNVMIREYTMSGCCRKALAWFNHMMGSGVRPDKFTFPFVVKACVECKALDKGKVVHGLAVKSGFFGDLYLLNALMDLYFKCGDRDSGCKVFDQVRVKNVVLWTTMVSGLVGCGELEFAREVFERMPVKNVVSWTVMIDGYVRSQRVEEAFELFGRMQCDNVRPNEFTLVSLLRGCVELESLDLGRWIHEFALKNGFKIGVFLGTALIDMYSKCGSLEDARRVFDEMQVKSVATWNAMITSLGVHGFGEEALQLFEQMEKENVNPDAVTFVGVLSSCVNTNDVEKGFRYFVYMRERYGIEPVFEHYICMIELYSQANMSDELTSLATNLASLYHSTGDKASPSDIKKFIHGDIREVHSLGVHTDQLSECRPQCFKWDVG